MNPIIISLLALLLIYSNLSIAQATQEYLIPNEEFTNCDNVGDMSKPLREELCRGKEVKKWCPDACALTSVPTKAVTTESATASRTQFSLKCIQRDALVDLYLSTNGEKWPSSNNWLTNLDECSWSGVTCDANDVTEISFYNNRLSGTIPSSLGQLTSLSYLYLSNNSLTGTIPPSLGQLTSLSRLWLHFNNLSGTIPSSLGHLTSLSSLALSNNSLTGTIPSSLGQLTSLPDLYLYNNNLTGTIPSSLGQLTSLSKLALSNNGLTGTIPSSLGQLTSLSYLWLYNNNLTGTIPSSLGQLTSLSYLLLHNNNLTGSVPAEVCALTLKGLRIYIDGNNGVTCDCCVGKGNGGKYKTVAV